MSLSWQEGLFAEDLGAGPPTPADEGPGGLDLAGLHRIRLDERSWLDVARGAYAGHGALFDLLLDTVPWRHRERRMYDRDVLEPRLVAAWSGDELVALPEPVEQARRALSEHYDVDFDSVLVNLYRDGRDGVAWHGDTVRHRLDEAVVVTLAVGERRGFLLRPGGSGPATHHLTTGQGDLVVMGGRCQHEWQHTVPKAARAGARMSITMRHSRRLRPVADSG